MQPQEPGEGEPDESGGGSQIDELQERSEDAEKEKQNQDSTKRGQDGSRNYVEKPW